MRDFEGTLVWVTILVVALWGMYLWRFYDDCDGAVLIDAIGFPVCVKQ